MSTLIPILHQPELGAPDLGAPDLGPPVLAQPASDLHRAISALRAHVVGEVLEPTDDVFGEHCATWNPLRRHQPEVIVVAATVGDIAHTVWFAGEHGRAVTIQATGHGASLLADGGVLLITSRLTDVVVDPESRTAKVSCGAKWRQVLDLAQLHGLAPLLGSSSDVGAVGFTLGGGMGWLSRRHGLAADSLRSIDIVLADGREVRASASRHAELFWAMQGAGAGAFGVVTAITIALQPVTEVYAGNLLYPVEMAAEVMARYRDWVADIDDRFTSSVLVMNFPPIDAVPEPVRGRSFVVVRGCWCGDLAEGAALVNQWRSWRSPAVDMFAPMPFAAIDAVSNDPVDPLPSVMSSESFDELPDDAIEIIVGAAGPNPAGPPMLAFAELRHAGGAIRRGAEEAANSRSRAGMFLLTMLGVAADPEHERVLSRHIADVRARLAPFVTGAAVLNFMDGAERFQRSQGAISDEHLARLRSIKASLDGGDVFRRSQRIEPAR